MYRIKIEQFNGPFNILLQLIEKEKLDITEISLANVADEFLNYVNNMDNILTRELTDFLEIASKLILFKSRLLIPDFESDEDNEYDLVNQLKIYREFINASKQVSNLISTPNYSFNREKIPIHISNTINKDLKINTNILENTFKNITQRILKQIKLSKKTIKIKAISLKSKINELLDLIKKQKKIVFNNIVKQKHKTEKAVMFLAVLELVKQRQAEVYQQELFGNITIKKIS